MEEDKHACPVTAEIRDVIYVIDDDASVRVALERLLISAGFRARTYASAADFLAAGLPSEGSCIITDVKMPGMSGLELHRKLCEAGSHVPVIFVTAYDTEDARAQARRGGAVAYFRKPVDDQALIDAIGWALSRTEEQE
jgi:FixJ family two-component response regulator